jgi:hypothetical protein
MQRYSVFEKLIHFVCIRSMSDRRLRAFVLALTEHIEHHARPPIPPNHVWLCEYTEKAPICSKSDDRISGIYGDDAPYTCNDCNITYFECTECWEGRNDDNNKYDYRSVCIKCEKSMIICHKCVVVYTNKSKCLRDIYECRMCMHGICLEHSLDAHCMDCGTLVRICDKIHTRYVPEYIRCHSCRQHDVM